MNELALFAGAGGGILGGQLLGWRTVCAVERDAYASAVLAQRQNDGHLDFFPIWSDVTTFDGRPWRGVVDVVSGGFPCQDISCAGKGEGITGSRSGLWKEFKRIVCQVRPTVVWVENSPILTSRGIDVVLGDLASMGLHAEWGVLSAEEVGARHKRERIWILAYSGRRWRQKEKLCAGGNEFRVRGKKLANASIKGLPNWRGTQMANPPKEVEKLKRPGCPRCRVQKLSNPSGKRLENRCGLLGWTEEPHPAAETFADWSIEPAMGRVANGVAYRMDRIKAIGNGQVPLQMAEAWRKLLQRIKE